MPLKWSRWRSSETRCHLLFGLVDLQRLGLSIFNASRTRMAAGEASSGCDGEAMVALTGGGFAGLQGLHAGCGLMGGGMGRPWGSLCTVSGEGGGQPGGEGERERLALPGTSTSGRRTCATPGVPAAGMGKLSVKRGASGALGGSAE